MLALPQALISSRAGIPPRFAALGAAAIALLSLGACSSESPTEEALAPPPPRPVRVLEIQAADTSRERTFVGRSQAPSQAAASFRIPGRVERRAVNLGDSVRRGDLLAALDASDFRLRLEEASAEVARSEAEWRNAEAERQRLRALFATESTSRSALDAAEARYDGAEAARDSAQRRQRLARAELGYTRLRASAAGRVVAVEIEAGENVQSGQAVLRLATGNGLEVEFAVPEGLISRLELGQEAAVDFPADGIQGSGRISEVGAGPVGDGGGAFPVVLRLQDPDPRLLTGRAAEVTLRFAATTDALLLPPEAVAADDRGRFVWVAVPQSEKDAEQAGDGLRATVERRNVEVGELLAEGLEVLSGLAPGDRVITAGVSRILEGQTVRLLDHDPLAEVRGF
ncbi:MAG: efflux RND transporter periplasmic adaptor subunit [Acidobacteriota bacterium]